ncbi:MAG: hypothetical protein WAJ85_03900 [Candidatus Baltobacteraceae bacterium]|jgi:hypothetical protein
MMPAEPGARSADFLTRTTLQIEEGLSMPSIAQVIRVLQRVPGVLLAEIPAGTARAIVAHDPAVPTASLLAAAAGAGVRATIVADPQAATVSSGVALPAADMPARRLLVFAGVLVFLLAVTEATRPTLAISHFLLPVLLSAIWAFVIARAMMGRHP